MWRDGELVKERKDAILRRRNGRRMKDIGALVEGEGVYKPEPYSVGTAIATEAIDVPQSWAISSDNDPNYAEPRAPKSVSWKRKPNGYRGLSAVVHVYLQLPAAMAEGAEYVIRAWGVNTRQEHVAYRHDPRNTRSEAVHVSAIGFRPDDPAKRGFLSLWKGTGGAQDYPLPLRVYLQEPDADGATEKYFPGATYHVLDDRTGESVLEGQIKLGVGAHQNENFKTPVNYAQTPVHHLDFSALSTPGRYRLYVEGVGCSYPFEIADDVWQRAFSTSMFGLLHHRSGIALGPPLTDFVRPRPMHPADGAKVYPIDRTRLDGESDVVNAEAGRRMAAGNPLPGPMADAWGGYMDAGDWDRRSNHLWGTYQLLELCGLFPEWAAATKLRLPEVEVKNALPDVLDEAAWNLDFYRRLQQPDGGVRGGIESSAHPRAGECSWQESLFLGCFAPDPVSSYLLAACGAKMARVAADIDAGLSQTWRESALRAWQWSEDNGEGVLGRLAEDRLAKVRQEHVRARNLAAVELLALTGETRFQQAFADTTVLVPERGRLLEQEHALFAYATLPEGVGDAGLKAEARAAIVKLADTSIDFMNGNSYGIATAEPNLPPMGYVGYFSVPGTISRSLPRAYYLTGDERYLSAAVLSCQFAAGANPDNICLTSGLGPNPVKEVLHVDARHSAQPAPPGITVYGPSDPAARFAFDAWVYQWIVNKSTTTPDARTWPAYESYWDIGAAPYMNEYTVTQTMMPTAYTWGFLAARAALE